MNNQIEESLSSAVMHATHEQTQPEKFFTSNELSYLEKISFWVLLITTFLLPIVFYVPFAGFPLDYIIELD